jgi:prepilin-type N-terminal cleavage/methylation domain-containing protein
MNIKQLRHPAETSKGVTLIEILMVIGVVAVLMSFAVPSVSNAAIKAEMSAAIENLQYSLQIARKVSRTTESALEMHISPVMGDIAQTITFTSPKGDKIHNTLQIQDYTMPSDIVMVSERESFIFDSRGLVQNPGSVSLVSKADESVSRTIDVQ